MSKHQPQSKILESSKELFERYGYAKTTLTDIAKSVGKVKTAIYYYFSGKDEIFAQLVKSESNTFLEKLIITTNKSDNPTEKLEKYVETRIILMRKLATSYRFLKQEFFELMPIVEENRKEADVKELSFVKQIMEDISASKENNIQSPEFASKMLVKTLKGLEIQMYVTDQIKIENKDLEDFRNFILYGLISKT